MPLVAKDFILGRPLLKAALPSLRFHDLRHMAGTLMHEAGVPLKRGQEILGHVSERTTLAIYTHSMRRARRCRGQGCNACGTRAKGRKVWKQSGNK
jgi:Phage integrase family